VFDNLKELTRWPTEVDAATMAWLRLLTRIEFAALLLVALACIGWTYLARQLGPKVTIVYAGGPSIRVPQGPTLLEISRMRRVPHVSVCGGRARCSTCRVRIDKGSSPLAAPKYPEIVTLGSIGAPPNVRLACQLHPVGTLVVTRLLKGPHTGAEATEQEQAEGSGVEMPLAVLFVDLRAFTQMSEKRLPFDVVFVLNEFFAVVGLAISKHGGWIDKFLGDGLLAVFGQRDGIEEGCRQALRAVHAIDLALDEINAKLETELGRPLQVGMGLDAGPLVLGRIGYGDAVDFTVIGNTVNVASRLEALSKEKGFQIMLSRKVARHAGWEPTAECMMMVPVRGVAEPIEVVGIARGRDLPESVVARPPQEMERPTAWTMGLWRGN
jgi:adenylate cyclase